MLNSTVLIDWGATSAKSAQDAELEAFGHAINKDIMNVIF